MKLRKIVKSNKRRPWRNSLVHDSFCLLPFSFCFFSKCVSFYHFFLLLLCIRSVKRLCICFDTTQSTEQFKEVVRPRNNRPPSLLSIVEGTIDRTRLYYPGGGGTSCIHRLCVQCRSEWFPVALYTQDQTSAIISYGFFGQLGPWVVLFFGNCWTRSKAHLSTSNLLFYFIFYFLLHSTGWLFPARLFSGPHDILSFSFLWRDDYELRFH